MRTMNSPPHSNCETTHVQTLHDESTKYLLENVSNKSLSWITSILWMQHSAYDTSAILATAIFQVFKTWRSNQLIAGCSINTCYGCHFWLGNSRSLSPLTFGLCCYNEDDVFDDVSALFHSWCWLGNSRWLSPRTFGLCCYNESDVYDDVSAWTAHGVDQRS